MIVNNLLIFGANPFFEAYVHSDFLGKCIFIGLILLSMLTWIILIYKGLLIYQVRYHTALFNRALAPQFVNSSLNPLTLELPSFKPSYLTRLFWQHLNPLGELYVTLKKNTIELLNKNLAFKIEKEKVAYLSAADMKSMEARLYSTISLQVSYLEKNLFMLATIVSLGPFLGLLGTVWGILTTFSELQATSSGNTNQMVLNGLSLALATTVLGLIDAIPALIGYNYLKNSIRDFETEIENFSTHLLTSIEMHYRRVEAT